MCSEDRAPPEAPKARPSNSKTEPVGSTQGSHRKDPLAAYKQVLRCLYTS